MPTTISSVATSERDDGCRCANGIALDVQFGLERGGGQAALAQSGSGQAWAGI